MKDLSFSFGKQELALEAGQRREWLVTNGIGGFASSTLIGLNTRRYHGLLIAALNPPINRRLLAAKLDEDLWVDGRRYVLGTNQVYDGYPQQGYRYLEHFDLRPFPTYTYRIEDLFLLKRIFMIYGTNTTVVHYRLYNQGGRSFSLYLFPLINCRDFHSIIRENNWPFRQQVNDEMNRVVIEPFPSSSRLMIASDRGIYTEKPSWYRGLFYRMEEERGLECYEDHYLPGYFLVSGQGYTEFFISFSIEEDLPCGYQEAERRAIRRRKAMARLAGSADPVVRELALAADDFLVKRKSTGSRSIIAGYPWFSDWGRDAMVSLPGLTLCTRRFHTAKEILTTFAEYCWNGLLPNMFPDRGEAPLYNTVDAPLWFFYGVQKYLAYTGDDHFVKDKLFSTMTSIVEHYRRGTNYDIVMDDDGLIMAGYPGIQLTWMDAKVGDWVVTPRNGKPVEVSALWYNALMLMSELSIRYGLEKDYRCLADKVAEKFQKKFWNRRRNCLFDLDGDRIDDRIRPNQIIAVSLPYSPLHEEMMRGVVDTVGRELYIGAGLRSLTPKDPEYRGCYQGDQVARDGAYHQGTAWSWLIGHFITAWRKVYGDRPQAVQMISLLITPLLDNLREQGVGSVSEIFDGSFPYTPRGCFAQAWGVAELLRVYREDLFNGRD